MPGGVFNIHSSEPCPYVRAAFSLSTPQQIDEVKHTHKSHTYTRVKYTQLLSLFLSHIQSLTCFLCSDLYISCVPSMYFLYMDLSFKYWIHIQIRSLLYVDFKMLFFVLFGCLFVLWVPIFLGAEQSIVLNFGCTFFQQAFKRLSALIKEAL